MSVIELPYMPRLLQRELHESLKRFNVLICHRRFGKTVFALNEIIKKSVENPREKPSYAYICPTKNQARQVAWDYLKTFLAPLGDAVKFYEQALEVRFYGRVIRLLGAAHADRLRGLYLDGVVLDEMADIPMDVWSTVVRPALSDRRGWSIFIGTPKGQNQLFELYQMAERFPKSWQAKTLPASMSGVLDAEELKAARESMSEAQYAQEFECSFDVVEEGLVRRSWFNLFVQSVEFKQIIWSFDTAIKAHEKADYSVGGLWGVAEDGYYLLDVMRVREAYPDLKKRIINLCTDQPADAVLIEDKASGQQLVQDLKSMTRLPVLPILPKGDKYTRLNVLTPVFESGKIFLPKNAKWLKDYIDEMVLFPHSNHDDQVDMTTQALKYLTEREGAGRYSIDG
ncbi:MAG: phage terminase large subunit [Alphaproteobacteria bacterium]|nr:phage terminase large subunit [Alphaproteobacteria bacterium]